MKYSSHFPSFYCHSASAFERIVDQASGTWGFKTRVASLENCKKPGSI